MVDVISYTEYLRFKRDRLLREVEEIDKSLFLLGLNGSAGHFIGYTYYVDKALQYFSQPVTAITVFELLYKHPVIKNKSETLVKAGVASVLSVGSRNDRYLVNKIAKSPSTYTFNYKVSTDFFHN